MRKIFLLLVISVCAGQVYSQDSLGNLKELKQLLMQRKDQFDTYAKQADERSGIFGNKTKKDLEKSREILLQIVKIDNSIMDELNRAITNRGMAKADYSTDQLQYTTTIQQLTLAADTLEKQLNIATEAKASLQKKITLQQWAIYFLCAAILIGLWQRFRLMKR